MKRTRTAYEKYLNKIGVPEDDKKSNGGRVPDCANYGGWCRRNDPIAFEVGFGEFKSR